MSNANPKVNRAELYLAAVIQAREKIAKGAASSRFAPDYGKVAVFPSGLIYAPFFLTIERVDPPVPTKARPATLFFTLTNDSPKISSGTVSSDWGGTVRVANLAPGTSISSSLVFVPATAGNAVSILVTYIEDDAPFVAEFRQIAAEDALDVNVTTGYILEIAENFRNPAGDLRSAGAAAAVCQNRTAIDAGNLVASRPTLEWEPVLSPDDELGGNVGISGWVCSVNRKPANDPTSDLPFLHPFFNDWTLYMAPDESFSNLLSPGDIPWLDQSVHRGDPAAKDALVFANQHSDQIGVQTVNGQPAFIEFEMEQGLLAGDYWPSEAGERVAALGRWIVDCGHDNFSSEIHPPLVLARATAAGDETQVKLIGRAFLTSQWFGSQSLLQSLLGQLGSKEGEAWAAISLFPPALELISPMEAKPHVFSPPFEGIQSVMFTVRPPTPRLSPDDTLLLSYHFTVRTGVYVSAFSGANPDEVAILVILNDAGYVPAPLPPEQTISISFDDLIQGAGSGKPALQGVLGTAIALNPAVEAVLAKGITTTRYQMPPPQSSKDGDHVVTDQVVDPNLRVPAQPFAVDDEQPYPIYGWLNLRWKRSRPSMTTTVFHDPRSLTAEIPAATVRHSQLKGRRRPG
jgi:hypothetical protein